MLTPFQQSPIPHTTNVFAPTCSAQAPSDYVTSIEAVSQHMTEANNPVLAELIRRDMFSTHAERNKLFNAISEVATPWYRLVKVARKMLSDLMGWENVIDPDLEFAEKHKANLSVIRSFYNRYHFIKSSTFTRDISNIDTAYLEGISAEDVPSDPKARAMLANFEYTRGKRMDLISRYVKDEAAAKEAELLDNNISSSNRIG